MDKQFWISEISRRRLCKGILGGALALVALVLAGCQQAAPTATPVPPTATPVPPTTTPLPPTPTPEPQYPTHANLPYIDDGESKHVLDVYLPEGGESAAPTLFVVPGLRRGHSSETGKSINQPREELDGLGQYFAERGYAVVLIDYRHPSEAWQQWMTRDALCALAWVHANADTYGFDPEHIAVLGEAWGAGIAANLVMADPPEGFASSCPHALPEGNHVNGVVTFGGMFLAPQYALENGERISAFGFSQGLKSDISIVDLMDVFETLQEHPAKEWRDSDALDQTAKDVARLLPSYWVDESRAPFLLLDGRKSLNPDVLSWPADQRPSSEGESFGAALKEAGVQARVEILDGARYDNLRDPDPSPQVLGTIEAFLKDLFAK